MRLLAELKRRNVIRVAGLYLVAAWLVVQVAGTLLPAFDVSTQAMRALVIVLALGFVPALVAAWIFELTPDGLRRDDGIADTSPAGRRSTKRMDAALLIGMFTVVGLVVADRMWPSDAAPATSAGSADAAVATDGAAPPTVAGTTCTWWPRMPRSASWGDRRWRRSAETRCTATCMRAWPRSATSRSGRPPT